MPKLAEYQLSLAKKRAIETLGLRMRDDDRVEDRYKL
jgi:hypothetical protein